MKIHQKESNNADPMAHTVRCCGDAGSKFSYGRGITMTIAQKIKALRKQAKLTQTELGDMLGVQKNAVSKWECGRVTDIPAGKIKAMAKIFDVPPSYLIDNESPEIPQPSPEGSVSDNDIKFALFGGDQEISDEMYEEVKQFAAFVKARNKK